MQNTQEAIRRKAEREAQLKKQKEEFDKQKADIAAHSKTLEDMAEILKAQIKKDIAHDQELASQAKLDKKHDKILADHGSQIQKHQDAIDDLKSKAEGLRQEIADRVSNLQVVIAEKEKELKEIIETKANKQDVNEKFKSVELDLKNKIEEFQKEIEVKTIEFSNTIEDLRKEVSKEVGELHSFDETLQIQLNAVVEFARDSKVSIENLYQRFDTKLDKQGTEIKLLQSMVTFNAEEIVKLKGDLKSVSEAIKATVNTVTDNLKHEIEEKILDLKNNELKNIIDDNNKQQKSIKTIEEILDKTKEAIKETVNESYEDLPTLIRVSLRSILDSINKKESKDDVAQKIENLAKQIKNAESQMDEKISEIKSTLLQEAKSQGINEEAITKLIDKLETNLKEIVEQHTREINTKLDGHLSRYGIDIGGLEDKISSLNTRLTNIENSVNILKDEANNLTEKLDTLPSINKSIENLKSQLESFKGKDKNQEEAIANLKSYLNETHKILGSKDLINYGEKLKALITKVEAGVSQETFNTEIQNLRESMPKDYVKLQDLASAMATVTKNFQTNLQGLENDVSQNITKLASNIEEKMHPLRSSLNNVSHTLDNVIDDLNDLGQKPDALDETTNKIILKINDDLQKLLLSSGEVNWKNFTDDLNQFSAAKTTIVDALKLPAEKFDSLTSALASIKEQGPGFKMSHQEKIQVETFMVKVDYQAKKGAGSILEGKFDKFEELFQTEYLIETVKALNEIVIKSAYKDADTGALKAELDKLATTLPKELNVGRIIKSGKLIADGGSFVILKRAFGEDTMKEFNHLKEYYRKESSYQDNEQSFASFILKIKDQLDDNISTSTHHKMMILNSNVEDLLNELYYLKSENQNHWKEAMDEIHLASQVYDYLRFSAFGTAKEKVHEFMPEFSNYDKTLIMETHHAESSNVIN